MDPSNTPSSLDEPEPAAPNRLLVRTWSDGEALLVRQLLGSYGIPCQVVSDVPHTVLPLSVDGLGEIRILVPASRFDEACSLLADHLRHGLEVVDGGKTPAQGNDDDSGDEDQGAA